MMGHQVGEADAQVGEADAQTGETDAQVGEADAKTADATVRTRMAMQPSQGHHGRTWSSAERDSCAPYGPPRKGKRVFLFIKETEDSGMRQNLQ